MVSTSFWPAAGSKTTVRPLRSRRRSPTAPRATRPSASTARSPIIPASYVAVHVGTEPPHEIVVEGHVEESRLFGPQVRMVTQIATVPGSNTLVVRDEFVNLKEQPVEIQILYHWNFGPPFLGPGSRFVAPIKSVTPRDARAQQGLGQHDLYGGPEPGSTEQVYYHELHAGSAGDSAHTCHAPQPGRRQGGCPAIPKGPAPRVHALEKHRRSARRLRDRPRAGHELPECPAVREGTQPGRDPAGRRPLCCRDDPRGARHGRSCHSGRGRDQSASRPRGGQGESEAHRAIGPEG